MSQQSLPAAGRPPAAVVAVAAVVVPLVLVGALNRLPHQRDARVEVADAVNLALVEVAAGRYDRACARRFAFGPPFLYPAPQICEAAEQRLYGSLDPFVRRQFVTAQVDPRSVTVLASGQALVRARDLRWRAGRPRDLDPTADAAVFVLQDVPGLGWRQVGYVVGGEVFGTVAGDAREQALR